MITDEPPKRPNGYQNAQIIRSMIEHENSLQNYRLTWLMTTQGLLFAALGFAWDKTGAVALVIIVSVLGIFISASMWLVLRLSELAFQGLIEWWEKHQPNDYNGAPVLGLRTQARGFRWYMLPWKTLPWVFALAWLWIFVLNLSRADKEIGKSLPHQDIHLELLAGKWPSFMDRRRSEVFCLRTDFRPRGWTQVASAPTLPILGKFKPPGRSCHR
jgi:hypothetical protein